MMKVILNKIDYIIEDYINSRTRLICEEDYMNDLRNNFLRYKYKYNIKKEFIIEKSIILSIGLILELLLVLFVFLYVLKLNKSRLILTIILIETLNIMIYIKSRMTLYKELRFLIRNYTINKKKRRS